MTLFELSGIVAMALPFLISLLKKAGWTTKIKSWFAFAMSIVAAVITEGATGADLWNFNPAGVFAAFGVILPAAQAFYLMILKGSVVDETLENLPL